MKTKNVMEWSEFEKIMKSNCSLNKEKTYYLIIFIDDSFAFYRRKGTTLTKVEPTRWKKK
jgi:hypothetical protein